MTIWEIFLMLLLVAGFLLYAVVLMSNRFEQEILEVPSLHPRTTQGMETKQSVSIQEYPAGPEESSDESNRNRFEFEQFVASRFQPQEFTHSHSRSGQFYSGIYDPGNPDPDLVFNFQSGNENLKFAVECLWLNRVDQDQIGIGKDYQIANYFEFQENKKIPVFLIIGLGGRPGKPEGVYIIPLSDVKGTGLPFDFLHPYKRKDPQDWFLLKTDPVRLI
jgi:hypothetical protein